MKHRIASVAFIHSIAAPEQELNVIAGGVKGNCGPAMLPLVMLVVLVLTFLSPRVNAQNNAWTWVSGSDLEYPTSVYGTKGTAAAGNVPSGRENASGWIDNNGNFWVFGGNGEFGSGGSISVFSLNDLWEFNPAIGQWTWMAGTNLAEQPGVYGTQGTPAASNTPGAREGAASWTDKSGNLWLFGGNGYDAAGTYSNLNDLWEFNPATTEWAWIGGSSKQGSGGVYGTRGTAAAANIPGIRYYSTTFTDKYGNLWLFGGIGDDSQGTAGWLNDLWEYNPATGQWAWMAGDNTVGPLGQAQPGVYGTLGKPSASNTPGGRYGATGWTDAAGNLWLFGGFGFDSAGAYSWLNDLWKFDVSVGQWEWMSGGNSDGSFGGWTPGVPGQWMTPAPANTPSGRFGAVGWTDISGRLWLFGGAGIYDIPTAPELNPYIWNLDDLWMFDPSTNEWTWMDGVVSLPVSPNGFWYTPPGIYGTEGTPSITNLPGMRSGAVGLTDSIGRFWLFGGSGVDSGNGVDSYLDAGVLNDLWVYQPGTTIQSSLAAPTFSPTSGTVSAGQSVVISDSSPGATIYYMIGQNAPPIEYTQPITVSSPETIVAIATANGFPNSSPTSATYTVPATATPSFSLAPGAYTSGQTVAISDGTPNALIYYTLDGTTPSTSSNLYQSPIVITSSETIQAVAVATGYSESPTATAVYTIWPTADLNEWAWMSGPSAPGAPRVWGSLGTPSIDNNPGSRLQPASWTDAKGNFWLFGGYGYDAHNDEAYLNDLWEFTPSTNEWAWMAGDSSSIYGEDGGQPGIYGTLGTPAAGNSPGGREGPSSWTDSKGNFWLFGGNGYDSGGSYSDLNDLWMYKESTNQWTWVGGSQTTGNCIPLNGSTLCAGVSGVYGTQGKAGSGNSPGARDGASTWVDSSGNLWLFGGHGVDPNGPTDYAFNDLWKYSSSTNEWTWIAGNNTDKGASCVFDPNSDYVNYCGYAGIYGSLGAASASNNPGGRSGASTWIDGGGYLWLFGGFGFDAVGNINPMNDLWEFAPSTSQWTWKGGNNTVLPCIADWSDTCELGALPVVYGTEGTSSAGNMPQYAANAATWTDKSGNFWLYSGSYTSSSYPGGQAIAYLYGWNNLWEYSPSANEWTWMNGTEVTGTSGPKASAILGIQGVPNADNSPGGVFGAPAWTDGTGNLWMFDGLVWKFQPSAPAIVPSFTLSPSPASISVAAGSSGSFAVSTTVGGGFNSAVTLSATGQPSGVTVQFNPTSISGAGSSQVAVSVGASVPTGNYTITITGVSGTIQETATISLTVTANVLPPSFTVSGTAITLNPGATTGNTSTVTLTPAGGFTGSVALTASATSSPTGAQYPPTLSFGSTSPVSITGTTAGTATLSITTTAATISAVSYPKRPGSPWYATSGAALACLLLFGIPARRPSWRTMLGMLMLLASLTASVMACGGGGNGGSGGGGGGTTGTTAGAYTITVTGTSGTTTETGTVTLTVQ